MRLNKKGDMGIGTLILFIAFILVAAVAASVLVSTTGALQSKALATGKATQAEVGTSISAVEVYAEDATSDNKVERFYFTVKLSAGSDPVRFDDVLLTVNTDNVSSDYQYDDTNAFENCTNTSQIDSSSATTYGIGYALKSDQQTDGYIFPGDVVKICFKAPKSMAEAEEIGLSLIPKVGASLNVKTFMPSLMKDKRVYVFP